MSQNYRICKRLLQFGRTVWGYQKDLTVIALIWTRLFTVRSGIVIWAGLSVEIYKVKNVKECVEDCYKIVEQDGFWG